MSYKSSAGKIIAFVGVALAVMGCKAEMEDGKMILGAESAREGIILSMENIPVETTRMFINITEWDEEGVSGARNVIARFTDIRGNALDQIKKTGKVICPFVRNGVNYSINVLHETENNEEPENWLYVECIADNGNYFSDGIQLALNDRRTAVELNGEPAFTSNVEYAPAKYMYGITIKKDGHWSIGVGDNTGGNTLSWEFEPLLTDEITASGYLESGSYPAYATAYCNTVYDNLTWAVEIAKSEEFTVNF